MCQLEPTAQPMPPIAAQKTAMPTSASGSIRAQRPFGDARRKRHERPDDRAGEAEWHRDRPEPLEPPLGPLDPLRRDVQPATVALEQPVTAVGAERPAERRAERVEDDACQQRPPGTRPSRSGSGASRARCAPPRRPRRAPRRRASSARWPPEARPPRTSAGPPRAGRGSPTNEVTGEQGSVGVRRRSAGWPSPHRASSSRFKAISAPGAERSAPNRWERDMKRRATGLTVFASCCLRLPRVLVAMPSTALGGAARGTRHQREQLDDLPGLDGREPGRTGHHDRSRSRTTTPATSPSR